MKSAKFLACLLPLLAGAGHAQDERRIVSPNGQLEFRLFTALPEGGVLYCLAYQVWLRGKPVLDTSYLGLNIHFQEPLLGETVGLSAEKALHGKAYNGLWADYLQTSSTGRRIQFEVRVYDEGVAFRYTVPESAMLMRLLLEDDATQFRFAHDAAGGRPARSDVPYVEQEPGVGWVGIYESAQPGFPRMSLARSGSQTMEARLPSKSRDPGVAFEGDTPWTGPWRMIVIAPDRAKVQGSEMLQELQAQKNR